MKSIEKLKAIEDVEVLLASWDDPQMGPGVYRRLNEGLDYLQSVHEVVMKIVSGSPSLEIMELCKLALKDLGLSE